MDRKGNKDFVDHFSKAVNYFMSNEEMAEMAEMICKDHPTLQQNKMRLFVAMLRIWADRYEKGLYDLRSESTCKLAAEIIKNVDPDLFYMPHV
jgi:hypothetical protein